MITALAPRTVKLDGAPARYSRQSMSARKLDNRGLFEIRETLGWSRNAALSAGRGSHEIVPSSDRVATRPHIARLRDHAEALGHGRLLGWLPWRRSSSTSLGVATNNDSLGSDLSDSKRGGAIAVGIVGGALVGALIGHAFFDPEPPPPAPPAPPPPPAPKKPLVVLKGANFAFDSASLNPAAHARLAKTLETLKANPEMRIEIRGFTDSVGSKAYNMGLSKRRADSVKSFFVSEGVAADRITTEGFGPANPVADNSTKEGQAENRRVEVHEAD